MEERGDGDEKQKLLTKIGNLLVSDTLQNVVVQGAIRQSTAADSGLRRLCRLQQGGCS
jgi:hypothetical protein